MTDTARHRHSTLWFSDGNIVLQAEQTLFNVHRAFLSRESDFFADMFALPQAADARDGTEKQPLLLPNVTAGTLANILTMMYTICGTDLEFDVEELVDILCVSHRLQFVNVLKIVCGRVAPLIGPERRLRLALDGHGVGAWALPAFHELVCAFDTHVELTGSPTLDHALWNAVYVTRVKVIQSRIRKAVDIANYDFGCSDRLCQKHLNAVHTAVNSSGRSGEVVARLAALDVERRSAHGQGNRCSYSVGFPPKWTAMFDEEGKWVEAGWDVYKSQT